MLNGWDITKILPVGKSANSFDLPTNCYFCTAAALQSTNCSDLVKEAQVMQEDTGGVEQFRELMPYDIAHKEYQTLQEVKNALMIHLLTHRAVAFAYNRVNGTGHMIVVFKAGSAVNDATGASSNPAWGNLRHIDYQQQNPQPCDGLLPAGENPSQMLAFHLLYRA